VTLPKPASSVIWKGKEHQIKWRPRPDGGV
jgi:hypothetical protein